MNAALHYMESIYRSAATVFDGMTITFSYLLRKPVTVQYPYRIERPVQETLPERYRGFLGVNPETCTSCEACVKACPIDCITLSGMKVPGRRGKAPVYFYIDLGKCMFCGLCVPPCPTDAIFFTREFEGSVVDRKRLIVSYIPEETARRYIREHLSAPSRESPDAP
jgi:formate hydrogenlyase subunit 6/NADH:ubiquinone oxidoreductase subunit I